MGIDISSIREEVQIKTSRSSGKGGQHVNKVESRVQLIFNIRSSAVLNECEKNRLAARLENRLSRNGDLIIADESTRSQLKNKEIAFRKLERLLSQAMVRQKKRRKTTPTAASKRRRLKSKKIHAEKKALRRNIQP